MPEEGHSQDGSPPDLRATIPVTPPSLQEVDEQWTVPWGAVDVDEEADSIRTASLSWHGKSDSLELHGHRIEAPMLYTSDGPAVDHETSCIDRLLPVDPPGDEPVAPVPHWASYASLSPAQRGHYLAWLASGRKTPLTDANYAFLFLYGLERRALMEKADPEDILRVLMQLLNHYENMPAFFSCVSRFAAFLFATKGIEKLKPAWFKRLFLQQVAPLHDDALSVAVTWLYERGKPLPPELALDIVRQDIRCSINIRNSEERKLLEGRFLSAYQEAYGDGMRLRAAEAQHTWKYRPINPSLQSWRHFASLWSVTSANIMGAYDQFQPLVELWRSLLSESTISTGWVALLDKYANAEGRVLAPVSKIAVEAGVARKSKGPYSLEECQAIVAAAREAGFEVLPNPDVLLRPFKARERVVVTKASAPHAESEPYYLAGTLLLGLGAAMADVDGELDHTEVLHVSEIVNSLYHFNDYDKARLGVLRRRLIKFPPKLTSLTRRVRAILTDRERSDVCKFLVGVAGANFQILDSELRALRSAYRAMGVPLSQLDQLLDDLVAPATDSEGPGIRREALARHMRETRAFAVQLGLAMQHVVPTDDASKRSRGIWYVRSESSHKAPATGTPARRAADPYSDALYALVQRGNWTDEEFVALGEAHGIYLPGGVGALSAWETDVAGEDRGSRLLTYDEDN